MDLPLDLLLRELLPTVDIPRVERETDAPAGDGEDRQKNDAPVMAQMMTRNPFTNTYDNRCARNSDFFLSRSTARSRSSRSASVRMFVLCPSIVPSLLDTASDTDRHGQPVGDAIPAPISRPMREAHARISAKFR